METRALLHASPTRRPTGTRRSPSGRSGRRARPPSWPSPTRSPRRASTRTRSSPTSRARRRRASPRWARRASSASSSAARTRSRSPPTGSRARGTRTRGSRPDARPSRPSSTIAGAWLPTCSACPPTASFALVTGCQMAHATGLAAARHRVLADAGHDVERDGLAGAPAIRVLAGAERHVTRRPRAAPARLRHRVARAGRGRRARRDARRRARGARWRERVRPADDRHRAGRQREHRRDRPDARGLRGGAGGGGVGPRRRRVRAVGGGEPHATARSCGASRSADSWATDGHKWLNVPYDCGIAFVRDREAHRARDRDDRRLPRAGRRRPARADGLDARVLPPGARPRRLRDPARARPRRRRRAGRPPVRLRRALRRPALRRPTASRSSRSASTRSSSRVGDDDATTDATLAAVQADGTCFPSGTTWRGRSCIRLSVCNWQTTDEDVDRSVEAMAAAA